MSVSSLDSKGSGREGGSGIFQTSNTPLESPLTTHCFAEWNAKAVMGAA